MNNKKNLMLMCPMLHQGGFERVCVATARLMQEYYNVYVLIFTSKDIHYDVKGLNVIDIDVPAKDGVIFKLLNMCKRIIKVRRAKKKLGIDYTYSFGSSANMVNALSGVGDHVFTGLRGQIDLENQRQIKLFARKSHRILSCSMDIVNQLKENFDYDRSKCIYNPVDAEAIRNKAMEQVHDFPFAGDDLEVIACMARDDYQKGVWHLVKAFYLALTKCPQARLLILGEGKWSGYSELVRKLGIKDKVAFVGAKTNPFPYVSAASIYVCPSNHEGFPNSVLEAMALKKPVISCDCRTGPREILLSEEEYNVLTLTKGQDTITEPLDGEYGILVPNMEETENFDAESISMEERMLAEEMVSLLQDEKKAQNYSDKAYKRAGFFTPDKYKEKLHNIIEKL